MEPIPDPGYLFRSDNFTILPNPNPLRLTFTLRLTSNYKAEDYTLEFHFFRHNFDSNDSDQCRLLIYHNKSKGRNCQIIGLLDGNYKTDEVKRFITEQQYGSLSKQFIFLRHQGEFFHDIDNKEKYDMTYPKNIPNGLFKLSVAYANEITDTKVSSGAFSDPEIITKEEIKQQGSIAGEHILINNIDIPIIGLVVTPQGSTDFLTLLPKIIIKYLNSLTGGPAYDINSDINRIDIFDFTVGRDIRYNVSTQLVGTTQADLNGNFLQCIGATINNVQGVLTINSKAIRRQAAEAATAQAAAEARAKVAAEEAANAAPENVVKIAQKIIQFQKNIRDSIGLVFDSKLSYNIIVYGCLMTNQHPGIFMSAFQKFSILLATNLAEKGGNKGKAKDLQTHLNKMFTSSSHLCKFLGSIINLKAFDQRYYNEISKAVNNERTPFKFNLEIPEQLKVILQREGNFYKKYLKYKLKYLELKMQNITI